jgi:hypothetical protein
LQSSKVIRQRSTLLRRFAGYITLERTVLITRRQTTFWEFSEPPQKVRVHFKEKTEWRFSSVEVPGFEVTESHPVLMDYELPSEVIWANSRAEDPELLFQALCERLAPWVAPWREVRSLFNMMADPVDILRCGYGQLMSGPASFLEEARTMIEAAGVKTQHAIYKPEGGMKALVAGPNYVLARDFRVEAL